MKKNLLLLAALTMCAGAAAQQLAFPGAEGFGAYATGGRGGEVVHVTNLKASGPGSLADAVSKSNRIVVFDVGGVIDVTNVNLTVAGNNITIAGQTAPGEGITIYGGRFIMSKRQNIIMRYIRMRGSLSMPSDKCTLTMDDCQNVILDHCSISWGRWDNIHITNAKDITYQNCIISEGIDPQNFGAITDGYKVVFTDGTQIEFDSDGNWEEISAKTSSVPADLVPEKITKYIKDNFGGANVVELKKDKKGYKVELSTKQELEFNHNYIFIGLD